jgi:hypothetical protein
MELASFRLIIQWNFMEFIKRCHGYKWLLGMMNTIVQDKVNWLSKEL